MSSGGRKITTLVPWYGGNRRLASEVGVELDGCSWVGIPFAGGMPELLYLSASTIVVSDLHRHVINLARILQDRRAAVRLIRELRRECFHADTLVRYQYEAAQWSASSPDFEADYGAAKAYFVSQWMNRSGRSGTPTELRGSLPVRWNANGGDSCRRYRSAVESLRDWRQTMARCNFLVLDVFAFLAKVQDSAGHGLYLDPPFPGVGDEYAHRFSEEMHRNLAEELSRFSSTRVLCRFYDDPLIRELYTEAPAGRWHWRRLAGAVDQHRQATPEVLICNQPLRGAPAASEESKATSTHKEAEHANA